MPEAPFASACLDASRTTENADQELRLRWRAVARTLQSDGAPSSLVDDVADRLLEPTGHGGPLPHLMPAVRLLVGQTPYVLVTVDHTGADIVCADASGLDAQHWRSEGDHDVIHKVPGGGWSHRRYQNRVEDSWDRDGEQVAEDLDRILTDYPDGPVLLVGDPYARDPSPGRSGATAGALPGAGRPIRRSGHEPHRGGARAPGGLGGDTPARGPTGIGRATVGRPATEPDRAIGR